MRAFNRLLGLVMGLAFVGAGAFCAFEVILAAIGGSQSPCGPHHGWLVR